MQHILASRTVHPRRGGRITSPRMEGGKQIMFRAEEESQELLSTNFSYEVAPAVIQLGNLPSRNWVPPSICKASTVHYCIRGCPINREDR